MEVVFADTDTASLILRVAHGTGFVGKALARIDQHVVGVIAADVRAHMELGVLRPLDPQIVAEFIVGGIEKIDLRALDDGRMIDVGRIAREVGVFVSSGLLPGDHGPPSRSQALGGPPRTGRTTPRSPPFAPARRPSRAGITGTVMACGQSSSRSAHDPCAPPAAHENPPPWYGGDGAGPVSRSAAEWCH